MTASEIAETLINGNISDARDAILYEHEGGIETAAVLALDVLEHFKALDSGKSWQHCIGRVRRCLEGRGLAHLPGKAPM